jgi:hypothetical protein
MESGEIVSAGGEYVSVCCRDHWKLNAGDTFPQCRQCRKDAAWKSVPPFDAIAGAMESQHLANQSRK